MVRRKSLNCLADFDHLVKQRNGNFKYQKRCEGEASQANKNLYEKKQFMDGKNLLAGAEAASAGISLQADRREKNKKRRVHITLELPWASDKLFNNLGDHTDPIKFQHLSTKLLITDLAGEKRRVSAVAKRLESLGALTVSFCIHTHI